MSVREAVIMAAGVGKRLKPFTEKHPKSLLDVGGRTLLERHLANLEAAGVERTTIVIGHFGDQIRDRFGARFEEMAIRYVENPRYTRGSILSMHAGLDGLRQSAVFMDADVLYHPEILRRLLRSEAPGCFLLDPSAKETGEEMMIGTRGGRCLKIARRVGADWDKAGEGVGFFALHESWLWIARQVFDDFLRRGVVDCEYEDALNALMQEVPCAFVETGDLPWTEIDFPEDVAKAEKVLARLKEMGVERG
ncbi:MAG: phosphocholine cytidylyltransferase family protein [Planctomycetes bacterium]|nr:phosphocholine cytidylyltransferase family protein [Planctomycetota bacterium]